MWRVLTGWCANDHWETWSRTGYQLPILCSHYKLDDRIRYWWPWKHVLAIQLVSLPTLETSSSAGARVRAVWYSVVDWSSFLSWTLRQVRSNVDLIKFGALHGNFGATLHGRHIRSWPQYKSRLSDSVLFSCFPPTAPFRVPTSMLFLSPWN